MNSGFRSIPVFLGGATEITLTISTMGIGQDSISGTDWSGLGKAQNREGDGRDVFFAIGLASKLVPEVLLFVQERRMTLCALLATLTFKR